MPPAMARVAVNDNEARKRVTKACDRCRLKKVKCDGNMPCPRCRAEDAVCQFGSRRKSTERAVSAGYVEQLEVQQQILVKALKAVWKRYVPMEAQGTLGEDPSVHAIVQILGGLEAPVSYRHLVDGFIFDEGMGKGQTSVIVEDTAPSPTDTRRTSDSRSKSPFGDIDQHSVHCSNVAKSYPTSPTFSNSSTDRCHQRPPPIDTTNAYPTPSVETSSATSFSSRLNRPKFCLLPPRPKIPPVVPVPMDMVDDNAYNRSLHPTGAYTDALWQLTPGDWMNPCFDDTVPMGSDFDHQMEDLMSQNTDAWKGVLDDSNSVPII